MHDLLLLRLNVLVQALRIPIVVIIKVNACSDRAVFEISKENVILLIFRGDTPRVILLSLFTFSFLILIV